MTAGTGRQTVTEASEVASLTIPLPDGSVFEDAVEASSMDANKSATEIVFIGV